MVCPLPMHLLSMAYCKGDYMSKLFEQTCYQVEQDDCVATALSDLEQGIVTITGSSIITDVKSLEPIKKGHKIAVVSISKGDLIIKYGVPIGKATKDIKVGEWVHLHNVESNYDERSSNLDIETGAPMDTKY